MPIATDAIAEARAAGLGQIPEVEPPHAMAARAHLGIDLEPALQLRPVELSERTLEAPALLRRSRGLAGGKGGSRGAQNGCREAGDQTVPFHRFVGLVKDQVSTLQKSGSPEVAFRVAMQDGKVSFTARGLKGWSPDD